MSISNSEKTQLDGGTVNAVSLDHRTGVITKGFGFGNGIHRSTSSRLAAEIISLKKIPISPNFLGSGNGEVYMTLLDGENHLDAIVDDELESIRVQIYRTAGKSLSVIHRHFQEPATSDVINVHLASAHKNLQDISARLCDKNIPTIDVIEYLQNNKVRVNHEIIRRGLTWTHGDFWLNNLIGRIRGKNFKLTGVIDWELSRIDTPYVDFAIVQMSLEIPHQESSKHFWKGYGSVPDIRTQNYFSVLKTIDWIAADPSSDLESDFYTQKLNFLKRMVKK